MRRLLVFVLTTALFVGLGGWSVIAAPASAAPSGWACYSTYNQACVERFGYHGQNVWGYPVDSSGNNCTNYVAFRLNSNGAKEERQLGNAKAWDENARARGYGVDARPAVGAVAQWNYGEFGHVAYVDWVSPDGTQIAVSETGYGVPGLPSMSGRSVLNKHGGGHAGPSAFMGWPDNFIHFKDVDQAPPSSNGGAEVKNVQFGRCLDVAGISTDLGAQMNLWDCNGLANQRWVYANGQLKVYGNSNRCLDADGSGASPPGNGRKVQIWECNGGPGQKWTPQSNGSIKGFDGRCLDADGTGASPSGNGRKVHLWDCNGGAGQKWTSTAIPWPPSSNGGAEVKNVQFGRCLDVAGISTDLGAQMNLWDCNGLANQRWVYANGQLKVYGNSNRCLDADGSGASPPGNGRKVQIWECNGGPGQKWTPQSNGSIKGFDGRCLDADGTGASPSGNGRKVHLWDCNGGSGQRWTSTAIPWPSSNLTLNAVVPAISGTAKVGSKLTVKNDAWGPEPVTLTYQWKVGDVALSGANGTSLVVPASAKGKTITVAVTGSKSGYKTATKESAKTKIVVAGTLTGATPKISGTAKVGGTLSARPGSWTPSGTTLTYQWYRNATKINGANVIKYKLVKADKGKKITVKVTGKKNGYTTLTKTSKKTGKVK